VVAGYRLHKTGDDAIGSLLLGLYNDRGVLASVGVIGSFPMATRRDLLKEMQPLVTTFDQHPWNWAAHHSGERTPRKNEMSRWNNGKDLSFVPLRPERVVEVRYDYTRHPDWYHNLIAHPDVRVEVAGEAYDAVAVVAAEPERERLFAAMAAHYPWLPDLQAQVRRTLPVVTLVRT